MTVGKSSLTVIVILEIRMLGNKHTPLLTHGVSNGKVLATLSTTSSENAATVLGSHASTETMLVETAMVVWLESHLHS